MQGQHSPQSSFFGMMYADLVPADHLPRRIAAAVDLEFVSELVRDCFCPDNGRPSWERMLRACNTPSLTCRVEVGASVRASSTSFRSRSSITG